MSLADFYMWAENSGLGAWVRSYTYAFSLIQVVHLMAMTTLLGTIFTVNLRMLGLAMTGRSVSEVADGVRSWTIGGYIVTMTTGFAMFASEAIKMSSNTMWSYKVVFLFMALILQFTMHRMMTKPGRAEKSPMMAKLAAVLSILLWFAVGMSARTIAFI